MSARTLDYSTAVIGWPLAILGVLLALGGISALAWMFRESFRRPENPPAGPTIELGTVYIRTAVMPEPNYHRDEVYLPLAGEETAAQTDILGTVVEPEHYIEPSPAIRIVIPPPPSLWQRYRYTGRRRNPGTDGPTRPIRLPGGAR